MSIAFTFADKTLLDTNVIAPGGTVQYAITTTNGFFGRKATTIVAASGVPGLIDWRKKAFVINGVQKKWNDLKSRGGVFSSSRDWDWGNRPFKLKYHRSDHEILATSLLGNDADTVRFTTYQRRLFRENERAMIYFPHHMEEIERMFLLMAILQTEIHRQETARSNSAAAAGRMSAAQGSVARRAAAGAGGM
ncbi:hypothetical protein B0H12DRAFT_1160153 [Mycena haematopus]|nr:hypothetical protein B0H12DRAFT_1160153 [Mycena haematopus]